MLTWLSTHGVALLAGATTVLGLGVLAMAVHRDQPLHRKRLGELTLVAALIWLAGAWLPLPRWELPLGAADRTPPTALPLDARFDPAAGTLAGARTSPPSGTGREGLATDRPGSADRDGGPIHDPALAAAGQPPGPGANPDGDDGRPVEASTPRETGLDGLAVVTDEVASGRAPGATNDHGASAVAARPEHLTDAPRAATHPLPAAVPTASGSPQAPADDAAPGWLAVHGADLAALVFLVGAGVSLLWLCLGWWRLRRVLAATEPAPVDLTSLLRELDAADLRVRVLAGRTGPFCVGLRRPVIVLPAALVRSGDRRTLAHVLAHEIAHARQGDGLGRLLCALTLPAFWCHPLYWWLRRDLTLSAEVLADERAARLSDRRHYARDLLTLASTTLASGRVPAGARSIFGNPSEFTQRIDMLLRRHGPLATRLSPTRHALHGLAATAVTASALMLFGATPAVAQSADAEAAALRAEKALVEAELLREQKHALESHLDELRSTVLAFQDEIAVLEAERDSAAAGQAQAQRDRGVLRQLIAYQPGGAGLREHVDLLEQELDAITAEQQRLIEVFCATPSADMNSPEQPAAIQHLRDRLSELGEQRNALTEQVGILREKLGQPASRPRGPVLKTFDSLGWQRELADEQTVLTRQRGHLAQALDALAAVDDGSQPEVAEQRLLLRERLDATQTQLDTLAAALAESQGEARSDGPDEQLAALKALGFVRGETTGQQRTQLEALGYLRGQTTDAQRAELEAQGFVPRAMTPEQRADLEALGYLRSGTAGGGGQGQATPEPPHEATKQAETAPAGILDSALLDLIDRVLQARADLESLAMELSHQAPLVEGGLVSAHELHGLQVQLSTQERRLQILQTLIDGELGATEVELVQVTDQDPVDLARLRRLETRLEVLRSVR